MGNKLWARFGFMGEYEEFGDDMDALALALAENGIGKFERCPFGVEAPGFEQANYVSLFWGDSEATHVRDLTEAEMEMLRERLLVVAC